MASFLDVNADTRHHSIAWGVVEVIGMFYLMGQCVCGVGHGGYYQRVLPLVIMVNVVNHLGIKRTEPGIREGAGKDIFQPAGLISFRLEADTSGQSPTVDFILIPTFFFEFINQSTTNAHQ